MQGLAWNKRYFLPSPGPVTQWTAEDKGEAEQGRGRTVLQADWLKDGGGFRIWLFSQILTPVPGLCRPALSHLDLCPLFNRHRSKQPQWVARGFHEGKKTNIPLPHGELLLPLTLPVPSQFTITLSISYQQLLHGNSGVWPEMSKGLPEIIYVQCCDCSKVLSKCSILIVLHWRMAPRCNWEYELGICGTLTDTDEDRIAKNTDDRITTLAQQSQPLS